MWLELGTSLGKLGHSEGLIPPAIILEGIYINCSLCSRHAFEFMSFRSH